MRCLNTPEAILSVIEAAGGSIDGKTTLQKLTYFSSVKLGLDLGHVAQYYGPYSPEVAQITDDFVISDFLVEQGRRTRYNRTMYIYQLTPDGDLFAENIKTKNKKEFDIINKTVKTIKRVVGNNINVLSWAAKVYYILRGHEEITYEQITRTGEELGWNLSSNEIDSAAKLLSALGLARKSNA